MSKLSKADLAALESANSLMETYGDLIDPDVSKTWTRLYKRLNKTVEPGVSAGNIEMAMLATARGKLVKLATGTAYAAASKMATRLGVTVEDSALVGKWLAAQGWLSQQTLLDVLRKWDSWLPKARALGVPINYGDAPTGYTGQGTQAQRVATTVRRKPGLGG